VGGVEPTAGLGASDRTRVLNVKAGSTLQALVGFLNEREGNISLDRLVKGRPQGRGGRRFLENIRMGKFCEVVVLKGQAYLRKRRRAGDIRRMR